MYICNSLSVISVVSAISAISVPKKKKESSKVPNCGWPCGLNPLPVNSHYDLHTAYIFTYTLTYLHTYLPTPIQLQLFSLLPPALFQS
ncbi:hypothetical protein F4781DRAFT_379209 [Annulohypoxylon bovei var. microspora]|nr:hypothetical protein F4781DRAFT_379209 [Annulohypoxylon bovei var. microspora]